MKNSPFANFYFTFLLCLIIFDYLNFMYCYSINAYHYDFTFYFLKEIGHHYYPHYQNNYFLHFKCFLGFWFSGF